MKRDLTSVDVKSYVWKQSWVRYEQDRMLAPPFVYKQLNGRLDGGDNAQAKNTHVHTVLGSIHTDLHGESDFFFGIGSQSRRKLH